MSVSERAKTKEYIKTGLQGYERSDGVTIPGTRRIYKGLSASEGFDLRHIERWSAAKLATAKNRIQSLNTLTSRPFAVIIPRTTKQKKEARKFTGQDFPYQKEFIAQVQIQGRDKAVFRAGKAGIERKFPTGSKTIKQRFLFSDYLRPDESLRELVDEESEQATDDEVLNMPSTFREMKAITDRMMRDMPKKVYGQDAFYTLLTKQYGPIGGSAVWSKIQALLATYFNRYDPGGSQYKGHEEFVEQVIGFQMIGTLAQLTEYEIERERLRVMRKKKNKLRFSVRRKPTMCTYISPKTGKRCERKIGHKGKHKFPKDVF